MRDSEPSQGAYYLSLKTVLEGQHGRDFGGTHDVFLAKLPILPWILVVLKIIAVCKLFLVYRGASTYYCMAKSWAEKLYSLRA